MNYKEVAEAWLRFGFKNKGEIKKIAQERRRVCDNCIYKKRLAKSMAFCELCHCPLMAKVFSPKIVVRLING